MVHSLYYMRLDTASAAVCAVVMNAHKEVHCRAAWQQHLELVADVLLST